MEAKVIPSFTLLVFLMLCVNCFSQETLTNEKALRKAETAVSLLYKKDKLSSERSLSISLEMLELVDQVQGYDNRKIDVYSTMTNLFSIAKLHQESIKTGQKALKIYSQTNERLTKQESDNQKFNISYVYAIIAEGYEKLNLLDSAAFYHKKRIRMQESEKNIFYATAINNYGLFLYNKVKDKTAALTCFQKTYQFTKEQFPEHSLLASIRDNIADIYLEQGKVNEANKLYEENFRFFSNFKNNKGEFEDAPRLLSAGAQYMATDFQLNETARGIRHFENLQNMLKGVPLPPEAQVEYLNTKHHYLEKRNNLAEANILGKRILKLSDSIKDARMEQATKTLELMNTVTLNKVQLKNKLERIEKENTIRSQQFVIWIILLIACIIAGSLLHLYKTRQQRIINLQNEQLLSEQLIELTALKNKQLESEIESKKRDLSDFAINLSQSMEWAEELKQKIKDKKQGLTKEARELLIDLEQEIDTKIKFDENNQEFLERLDALSDSFYSQLKTLYPNLTKTERRLCSLIRLKLEPQQIANLQNISLSSIHTARYRLRKKMNLSDTITLDAAIHVL